MSESKAQLVSEAVAQTLRPAIHVIAYGDPGAGKTEFATTFPKPLLAFVFDSFGKDTPYLKWGRQHSATVTDSQNEWGTPIKDIVTLDGDIRLEYYNDISPVIGEDRAGYPHTWETFEWRMKERRFFNEGWATVVVDSVTFMEICARMYAKHVKNPDTREPRQWFNYSTDALEMALLVQLQAFKGNIVVLAHISSDKDEVMKTFVRSVSAPGRLQKKNELGAGYSELYHCYTEPCPDGTTGYYLQSQRDTLFNAATQIGTPNPCWQSYESLWDNFV